MQLLLVQYRLLHILPALCKEPLQLEIGCRRKPWRLHAIVEQRAVDGYAESICLIRLCLADSLYALWRSKVMHPLRIHHVVDNTFLLQPGTEIMGVKPCRLHTDAQLLFLRVLQAQPPLQLLVARTVVVNLNVPFAPINLAMEQSHIQCLFRDINPNTFKFFSSHIFLVLQSKRWKQRRLCPWRLKRT